MKTNEQRITEHPQLNPRKILNSIYLHSQSALKHNPGEIHKTARLSGAVKHKNLSMFKVFKNQAVLQLQDFHPDHTNDIPNHLRLNCVQALHSLGSFQLKPN